MLSRMSPANPGPKMDGNAPGQTKNGHVTPAHLFGGEVGGQRLAGGHDDHLADGDDDDIEREQPVGSNKAKQAKPDHIEERAERHHQERRTEFDAPRYPELEQDDRDGTGGHQETIALRVDAVVVTQIDRERAVHLLVCQQHEHAGHDKSDKSQVFEHRAISCKGLHDALAFCLCCCSRLGFGDEHIEETGHNTGNDRVDDEQVEVGSVCDQAADGWSDDPGNIGDHAQDTEALGTLLFWQDVCDHGLMGRVGDVRKQAGQHGQRVEHPKFIDQAQRERAQCAEDQAKQDQAAAPNFIGKCAADHAAQHAEKGEKAQDDAGLRHTNPEFFGNVKRKEGKQHGAADAVDEHDADDCPEAGGEFVIDIA